MRPLHTYLKVPHRHFNWETSRFLTADSGNVLHNTITLYYFGEKLK